MAVREQSDSNTPADVEPDSGHFEFGRNWKRFLSTVDEQRIAEAERSVQGLLGIADLQDKRVLDAGSGSGIFSLAAYRLGADVVSFDLDSESVACAEYLRTRYAGDDPRWQVLSGSLLDRQFLDTLGQFDVVYCWGVLHHTGDMWNALSNLLPRVAEQGLITVAIYNEELYMSRIWRAVKLCYQKLPRFLRPLYVLAIGAICFANRVAFTLVAICLRLVTLRDPVAPIRNWLQERNQRGMHTWYDLVDWVGGWPYEVAKPDDIFRFLRDRGYVLRELRTCSGHGCNEFVFRRCIAD